MIDELQLFSGFARPALMREWLEAERAKAIKTLTNDRDMAGIHQAQGRVQLLNKMIELLEKARPM